MTVESADGQNESAPRPCVPKIGGTEFEQIIAVAQMAVKLCELQKRELQNKWEAEDKNYTHDLQTAVTEPEKKRVNEERNRQMESRIATLDPEGFLPRAWQLIGKARQHVVRAQTDEEYLVALGGSREAAEDVAGRILGASRVPFEKLCEPEYRNKRDTEIIRLTDAETGKTIEVEWRVLRSERAFDNLFWSYWDAASIIQDEGEKKAYGQKVLDSLKRNGLPPNTFLALASGYFDFERGVKVITGENRLDRALPAFRRFLKSRFAKEDMAERAMAKYRKRFAPREPYLLKDEFAKWKRKKKSRDAKLSREGRGKRGRVRSKSDKRLGGRPPSPT